MNFTKTIKYFLLIFFLPIWYLQKLIIRNKKIWVFGAWNGKEFSDNPKVLFEYVLTNQKHNIIPVWITKNKKIYNKLSSEGVPCEYAYSFSGVITCLKSAFVIIGSGKKDVNEFAINGATIINTWHGAPMKKIGLDYIKNSKLKFFLIKNLYPFFWDYDIDYLVSTHTVFNDKLSSAFQISSSKILTTGYPRNDLVDNNKNKNIFLEKLKLKFDNPKMIFYLPTFRDSKIDKNLFERYQFIMSDWDDYLINNNSILILKPHNIANFSTYNFSSERVIVSSKNEINEINNIFNYIDILVTDYSGIYFDFLLTDKKIILAPFDFQEYIKHDRELYFDYEKDFSEAKCYTWAEVLKEINKSTDSKINRRQSRINFNRFTDNKNSERLFNKIINLI